LATDVAFEGIGLGTGFGAGLMFADASGGEGPASGASRGAVSALSTEDTAVSAVSPLAGAGLELESSVIDQAFGRLPMNSSEKRLSAAIGDVNRE
jgi:hypothetical protein